MALTWIGHATALIALDGVRLITDPVLRGRVGPLVRVAPAPVTDGVDQLDGVLLSHLHADHTDLPSLRRISSETQVLAPYPAGAWLKRRGFWRVRELRAGEGIRIGRVEVTATRAVHDRRRRPLGPAADPIGYVIRGSRSLYFAGDTDLEPGMAELRGSVDIALVPISGWGSSVGAGHLDPKRAAEAVALVAPSVAVPIHWGTYMLPWAASRRQDLARPADEFVALARRYAPAVDLRVLAPGERIDL